LHYHSAQATPALFDYTLRAASGILMGMPVLFVGHGSPMNAIETNAFTQTLRRLSPTLPRPKAICVISAHWVTRGTQVLAV
jgi:aromatic ring-opening dioxygenase catalytic subunit (LigB family)